MKRSIAILLLSAPAAFGFAPSVSFDVASSSSSSSSALLMAKRGKGLSGVSGGSKLNKPKSMEGSETSSKAPANWQQTSIPSISSLPQEKNTVKVIDTNVPSLTDGATNPTGAVSIVNYNDKTYCFSSSCAKCKIPLTKAKVLEPTSETGDDARLQCDLCGATYNLRTGDVVEKEGGKLMGFLFSKMDDNNLPVYGLGEQSGKVFINVP